MRQVLCALLLCCPLLAQDNAAVPQFWSGGSGTFYVNGVVYQYAAGTDYTVVAAVRPVLNRKYLALKVRIINAGRQSVTVKPDEISVKDAFAEHALTVVSGAELGRRMRKPYNRARLAVDPAEASQSSEAPSDGMTPQMLTMMRAMAARTQVPSGGPVLPNKNLLYTDEPGALPMAPMHGPTAECGQVCQLLSRETAGPDVLAQLQRQTSPDYVERSALLANTILPQADTTGLLFYPMAKLSHQEGASGSGKNARRVKVTVPVGAERFEFVLGIE
jgi:hypothetical protein